MTKQEPTFSDGKSLPPSNPSDLALAAVQAALDTANAPDTAGAKPHADEQPEDQGKLYGVQVIGVVDPLIEHIDKSIEKWMRMRDALVARKVLLIQAAKDNAEFAEGARQQLIKVDSFIDKLTDDFEASVPTLPLAKAA